MISRQATSGKLLRSHLKGRHRNGTRTSGTAAVATTPSAILDVRKAMAAGQDRCVWPVGLLKSLSRIYWWPFRTVFYTRIPFAVIFFIKTPAY